MCLIDDDCHFSKMEFEISQFLCHIVQHECRCLAFPLDTHLDLDEEVPQVLLEGGDVLIQAEQPRYKHLHLCTAKRHIHTSLNGEVTEIHISLANQTQIEHRDNYKNE